MLQPTDTLSNIHATHWYHFSLGDHLHIEIFFVSNFTLLKQRMINNPSFHQWELGSLDQFASPNIWQNIQQSLSSNSYYNNSFNNPNSSITSNTFSGSSMDPSHTKRLRNLMKIIELKSTIAPNTTLSPRFSRSTTLTPPMPFRVLHKPRRCHTEARNQSPNL